MTGQRRKVDVDRLLKWYCAAVLTLFLVLFIGRVATTGNIW